VLYSRTFWHQPEENFRTGICCDPALKRVDDTRMSIGEELAVGAPVSCVSKFAIVNVQLPFATLRSVLNVNEFAVLSVTYEPTAPGCAPPRSVTPPRGGWCAVQRQDAISTVIEEELRAINDRGDIDPSVFRLVNPAHAAELITLMFGSTELLIVFNLLVDMILGRRGI
jgi:hypothetical protein